MASPASHPVRRTLIALVGPAAWIAGLCAGPAQASVARVPSAPAVNRASSLPTPAALPSRLLFIPTGTEAVNVYDLRNPNKKGPLAQITAGLVGTQYQMTVDGAANLFVVNDNFFVLNQQYVSVYAPPYTGAPTILSGAEFPLGVAVDASGTVYVSNCGTYCSQPPAVYVYQNGSTTPTSTITSPGFESLGGLALDPAGNLYVASSNRVTGASAVYEVPSGSTTPVNLRLNGLFNIGGPGIGSIAVDASGNLDVENNSNSMYILRFKHGNRNASSIIDPFRFFDTPGIMNAGPDGNLYVPINCGDQSCEGAVVGFKPKGSTPFEAVGAPDSGISGVATAPNPNFLGARTRGFVARGGRTFASGFSGSKQSVGLVAPELALRLESGPPARTLPAFRPHSQAFRLRPRATSHGGGWLSPAAKSGENLLYLSTGGNGGSQPAEVAIYSTKGQSQAPIGVLTDGINAPEGIGTDQSGNLYVANSGSNTVTVYPPGQMSPAKTYTNGVGGPYDVKVGTDGTVYVANAFATPSGFGTVTEYAAGSMNPSATISLPGENAISIALDASNNLYVSWYNLSSAVVQVYEYAPGSTSGTNLNLDLPAPSFPEYGMAVDHGGKLTMWYESFDHSTKYLAAFAPGSSEPQKLFNGGSMLSNVTGIAYPHSSKRVYFAAINVNEGDELTYPHGIPLDVIGLDGATGVALSPGT